MYYGFFDGACQGNPGPIGLGVCIYNEKGEIAVGAGPVSHGTNNDAEYYAAIKLLESSLRIGIKELVVYGDSQLIINQINGKWQAGAKFKPLLLKIEELKQQFKSVRFLCVARQSNGRADALSKRGLQLDEWKFLVKESCFENDSKGEGFENRPEGKEVSENRELASREVRIGKKFAVFVYPDKTVFYSLALDVCSCGQADCEHRQFLKKVN